MRPDGLRVSRWLEKAQRGCEAGEGFYSGIPGKLNVGLTGEGGGEGSPWGGGSKVRENQWSSLPDFGVGSFAPRGSSGFSFVRAGMLGGTLFLIKGESEGSQGGGGAGGDGSETEPRDEG